MYLYGFSSVFQGGKSFPFPSVCRPVGISTYTEYRVAFDLATSMSNVRRVSRHSASNTPSSSKGPENTLYSSSHGKLIVVSDLTDTRPTKRARTTATFATPQQTDAHDASSGDDDDTSDAISSDDAGLLSTLKKRANAMPGKHFVHRNAFDAYFTAASKPSRTSSNVFSQLVPPLTPEDYSALLRRFDSADKNSAELAEVLTSHERLFPRYALELSEGFNLLFFGFGSKRGVLNNFARTVCAKRGHVVVINGYMPRVGIKEVLESIEQVPGLSNTPLPAGLSGLDAQTRRIYDFFLPPDARPQHPASERPLFLVVHNIDSPALRAPKGKAALSMLALSPRIHIVASVDHVHAQTIWSTTEASARKHTYTAGTCVPPTRGFAWVWHDMTTMQPYDAELAHVDLHILGKQDGKTALAERGMTESAAQHILASVNAKAKKLFALLANTQLVSLEESGAESKRMDAQAHAVSYDALFSAARSDFIAMNDTSFKALLAEFRDHKLVVSRVGGGEALWIPLREEELRRLVASLTEELQ